VQPVAVYQKSDSLICSPAVRATIAAEPVWLPSFVQIADDEWEDVEEPSISMHADAAKLLAFIHEMEAARLRAAVKGHRADTALRLFARFSESTRQWSDCHVWDDDDVIDRSIVDGATLMEAISLSRREQSKSEKMASRLASILADNPAGKTLLVAEIKRAYKTRSDLVHADERPDREVLDSVAALFSRLARPALVAFHRRRRCARRGALPDRPNPCRANESAGLALPRLSAPGVSRKRTRLASVGSRDREVRRVDGNGS
jgi:hypothetical protein